MRDLICITFILNLLISTIIDLHRFKHGQTIQILISVFDEHLFYILYVYKCEYISHMLQMYNVGLSILILNRVFYICKVGVKLGYHLIHRMYH